MRSLATRRQHLATSAVLARRDRAVSRGGIRPGRGGDRRHRPERHRDRRSRRHLPVRHDGRIRRGEPAREDRHARLRRHRGAQQVRETRRRRCAARRAQAVAAQSSGPDRNCRTTEIPVFPDHRQPLQRSGREPAVPGAVRAARSRKWRSGRWTHARRSAARGDAASNFARAIRWCPRPACVTSRKSPAQGREARQLAETRAAAAQRAHGLYLSLQALGDSRPAGTAGAGARTARRRRPRCAARGLQPRAGGSRQPKRWPRCAAGRSACRASARPSIPTPCAAAKCAAPTTPSR